MLELLRRGAIGAGSYLSRWLVCTAKHLEAAALFLVRKSPYLLAAIFAGLAASCAWYAAEKRYYTSSLMLRAVAPDHTFYVNMLAALQGAKPAALARTLNMPEAAAAQVRSIEALYGVDANGDGVEDGKLSSKRYLRRIRDSAYSIVPNIFYVAAEVYNESCYAPLGAALLDFMSANAHVVSHKEFRRYRVEQELADVELQIRRLDSLQQSEYRRDTRGAALKLGGVRLLTASEKDRQLFHDQMFDLYGRRLNLEAERALYADAVVQMKGFIALGKPVNTLVFYMKRVVPLFFLASILCLVLARYRRDIWRMAKAQGSK